LAIVTVGICIGLKPIWPQCRVADYAQLTCKVT